MRSSSRRTMRTTRTAWSGRVPTLTVKRPASRYAAWEEKTEYARPRFSRTSWNSRELERIAARAPGAKEMTRARDHLKGNLVLGLESGGHRMMKLAKQEIYFGRQFTIAETLERIDEVTPADLRRLAGLLFDPARSAWSAVGPAASIEKVAQEVA